MAIGEFAACHQSCTTSWLNSQDFVTTDSTDRRSAKFSAIDFWRDRNSAIIELPDSGVVELHAGSERGTAAMRIAANRLEAEGGRKSGKPCLAILPPRCALGLGWVVARTRRDLNVYPPPVPVLATTTVTTIHAWPSTVGMPSFAANIVCDILL